MILEDMCCTKRIPHVLCQTISKTILQRLFACSWPMYSPTPSVTPTPLSNSIFYLQLRIQRRNVVCSAAQKRLSVKFMSGSRSPTTSTYLQTLTPKCHVPCAVFENAHQNAHVFLCFILAQPCVTIFQRRVYKLDVVMKVRMCLVYEASPFSTSNLSIIFRSLDFTKTVTNASM
jgi:hypothetical protein